MVKLLRGVVRGRTIELSDDVGLAEGQEVEVRVEAVSDKKVWGAGILRSAGALADDPHFDAVMEEIYQARNLERRAQVEDK